MCVTRVWERWLRDHEGARRLPFVLPLVLHHSEAGWTAATRVTELLDLEPDLLDAVRANVPEPEMLLDDLGAASNEVIVGRAMSAFARLVLLSLRIARSHDFTPETLALWARALRDAGAASPDPEALESVLRYAVQVLGDDNADVIDMLLAEDVGDPVREAYVTIHDTILERGRLQGIERGHRSMVRTFVEKKFGALSDVDLARIEQMDAAALDRLAERILVATSIDELWHAPTS